ncbi:MAG: hypothetical protein Q9174_003377 [Haloplaca sp. 1 TL-2023]
MSLQTFDFTGGQPANDDEDPFSASLPVMAYSNPNFDTPFTHTDFTWDQYAAGVTSEFGLPNWPSSTISPEDVWKDPSGLPRNTPANPLQSSLSTPTSSSHSSAQHHRKESSNSSRSVVAPDSTRMGSLKIENTTTGPLADENRNMDQYFNFTEASNSPEESVKTETSADNPVPGITIPQNAPSPCQHQQPNAQAPIYNQYMSSRSLASAPLSITPPQTTFQSKYFPAPQFPDTRFRYRGSNHTGPSPTGLMSYPSPANDNLVVGNPVHPFTHQPTLNGRPNIKQPMQLILPRIQDKTRVETQIPVMMALSPMPPDITKLRLPLRTLAKPKLIAKPQPGPSSDTLMLEVTAFCASALKVPRLRERAFVIARGEHVGTDGRSVQSIDPKDGGPINICEGCVMREQKRASRQKEKEPNDEDILWKQSEKERIVVFNDQEISDLKPYTHSSFIETLSKKAKGGRQGRKKSEENSDDANRIPVVPDVPCPGQAKQICLMMRITCYCRHQNESEGFQVIFTIKDYQGKCLVQQMSSPILITDDHKAAGPQNDSKNGSPVGENFLFRDTTYPPAPTHEVWQAPPMSYFDAGLSSPMGLGHSHSAGEFTSLGAAQASSHLFRSSTSVQMYQRGRNIPMQKPYTTHLQSQYTSSHHTTMNPTPRNNLSRPVSPSGTKGRNPKRRKASGSVNGDRRPLGNLAMTKISPVESTPPAQQSASPTSSSAISDPLVMGKPILSMHSVHSVLMTASAGIAAVPAVLKGHNTVGGEEPEFLENADTTTRPYAQGNTETAQPPVTLLAGPESATDLNVFSGSPPPTGQQQPDMGMDMEEHANLLTQGLNQLTEKSMTQSIGTKQISNIVVPKVIKVIPAEGSVSGGTEVTMLGQGFHQGVQILFGNAIVTQTRFWSSSAIVCITPPSSRPCVVPVMVRGIDLPTHELHAVFRYVDNQASDLLRLGVSAYNDRTNGGEFADASAITQAGFGTQSYQDQGAVNPQYIDGSMLYQRPEYPEAIHQAPLYLRSVPGSQETVMRRPINQLPLYGPQSYQPQVSPNVESSMLSILDLIDQADSSIPPCYDACNTNGQTMLHLSASLGFDKLAAGLLARGANADVRDRNGMTSMHMACGHWHLKVLRKLVFARADPTIRCLIGLRPADMAMAKEAEVTAFIGSTNFRQSSTRSGVATPSSYLSRSGTRESTPRHEWAVSRRNSIENEVRNASTEKEHHRARRYGFDGACDSASETESSPLHDSGDTAEYSVGHAPSEKEPCYQHNSNVDLVEHSVCDALPEQQTPYRDSTYGHLEWDLYKSYPEEKPFRRNSLCNSMDEKTLLRHNSIRDTMPGQQFPARRNSICNIVPDSEPVPPPYTDIYPPRRSMRDIKKETFARAVGDTLLDEKCAQLYGEGRFGATARMVVGWKNDWKLYCIWIPMLILSIVGMTKDWYGPVYTAVKGWVAGESQQAIV